MDEDTKLAELMKQVERNAHALDRTIEMIRDLGDMPVAFSREALVESLGFDCHNAVTIALPNGALRA